MMGYRLAPRRWVGRRRAHRRMEGLEGLMDYYTTLLDLMSAAILQALMQAFLALAVTLLVGAALVAGGVTLLVVCWQSLLEVARGLARGLAQRTQQTNA